MASPAPAGREGRLTGDPVSRAGRGWASGLCSGGSPTLVLVTDTLPSSSPEPIVGQAHP